MIAGVNVRVLARMEKRVHGHFIRIGGHVPPLLEWEAQLMPRRCQNEAGLLPKMGRLHLPPPSVRPYQGADSWGGMYQGGGCASATLRFHRSRRWRGRVDSDGNDDG